MILVAIDPSSTAVGYAVFEYLGSIDPPAADMAAGICEWKLREIGRFVSHKQTLRCRLSAFCADLMDMLSEFKPGVIVIEIPSGHVGYRHKGGGAGLSIYGLAVGRLWGVCLQYQAEAGGCGISVQPVTEAWTDGKPKADRHYILEHIYDMYQMKKDPGGDIGDAIGVGQWWLEEAVGRSVVNLGLG